MFEAILSKCLKTYLSDYIEPIKFEQMDLSVLKGSVKLSDLKLKETALTHHDIPFIVRKGIIKHIRAKFPWQNLRNKATKLEVRDVFIVLEFDGEVILKATDVDQSKLDVQGITELRSKSEDKKTLKGLLEAVIDNIRISIENIHIRVEIKRDQHPIAIGLVIPELRIITVDEDNQPVLEITHPKFVRKQCLLSDLSIYFDTDNKQYDLRDFENVMRDGMDDEHQYLLEPVTVDSLLIHTRDKSELVTNRIEATTPGIKVVLDVQQCHALLYVGKLLKKFHKIRTFSRCGRPQSFEEVGSAWVYANNCAVFQNRPYEFDPEYALSFLTHRVAYLELYRKAKNSQLSANLLGSPRQKLQALQKKLGKVALSLDEYSRTRIEKEIVESDTKSLSAFDMSALKNLLQSTEIFFSIDKLFISCNIPIITLELVYSDRSPLARFDIEKADGQMTSVTDGITMTLKIAGLLCTGYDGTEPKQLFTANKEKAKHVLSWVTNIPNENAPTQMDIVFNSSSLFFDPKSLTRIWGFLSAGEAQEAEETITKTVLYDVGEQLQFLRAVRNNKMSILLKTINITVPFEDQGSQVNVQVALSELSIHKACKELIQRSTEFYDVSFDIMCGLDSVMIDDSVIVKSDPLKVDTVITFYKDKLNLDLSANVKFGSFRVNYGEENNQKIAVILSILRHLPIFGGQTSTKEVILTTGLSRISMSSSFGPFELNLSDQTGNLCILMDRINTKLASYSGEVSMDGSLGHLEIKHNGDLLMTSEKSLVFQMQRERIYDPVVTTVDVNEPKLYLLFPIFDWIVNFVNTLLHESKSTEVSAKLEQTRSNAPQKRLSSLERIERFRIKQTEPNKFNLRVNGVSIEMIDPTANPVIGLGKVELVDNSPNGIILKIEKFFLRRQDRYVLRPVDMSLKIDLPNPITFEIDYAEAELLPEDIAALTAHSPEIFSFLFKERKYPLIPQTIRVTGTAKKGFGKCLDWNETVATAGISDAFLDLVIEPSCLKINVTVGSAYGEGLIEAKETTCVKYEGTMEYQKVWVDVPEVSVTVYQKLIPWIIRFVPPIPEVPEMSLLDVHVSVRPSQMAMCDGNGKQLFVVKIGQTSADAHREQGKLNLDLSLESFNIGSDFLDDNFIEMSGFSISLTPSLFSAHLPPLHVNLSLALISEMLTVFGALIPDGLTLPAMQTAPFDVDVRLEGFVGTMFGAGKNHALQVDIPGIGCLLNASRSLAAVEIREITFWVIVKGCERTLMLEITEIDSVLAFSKSLPEVTFKEIASYTHDPASPQDLTDVSFRGSVGRVVARYSHLVAAAIIDCFISERGFSVPPSLTSVTSGHQIQPHFGIEVKRVELFFIVLKPFAVIVLDQTKVTVEDSFEVSVLNLNANRVDDETKRCLIQKKNEDDIFLSLEIETGSCYAELCKVDFYVDYYLLITLTQFMLFSPLLHAIPNKSGLDVTFPFSLALQGSSIDILIPTSLDVSDCPICHLHVNVVLEISPTHLHIAVSDFEGYFTEKKLVSPPMFANAALLFMMTIENDGSLSFKGQAYEMTTRVSFVDINLVQEIVDSITTTMNSIVTTYVESQQQETKKITVSKVELHLSELSLTLCRDNRTSQHVVPLLKVVIPPIDFSISNSSSVDTIMAKISPYVAYFNQVTGHYDMLIEPVTLNVLSMLTKESFHIRVETEGDLNINVPISTVKEVMSFYSQRNRELTESNKSSILSQYPKFWVENAMGRELKFMSGQTNIILLHGEAIPMYEMNIVSLVKVQVGDSVATFHPNSVVYPTYLSHHMVVIRQPFRGGFKFCFMSPVQIQNKTSLHLSLYRLVEEKKSYEYVTGIKPNAEFPLRFDNRQVVNYAFAQHNWRDSDGKQLVPLPFSLSDKSLIAFSVPGPEYPVYLTKGIGNNYATGTRNIIIRAQATVVNQIEETIYLKFRSDIVLALPPNEVVEVPFMDMAKSVKFSLSYSQSVFHSVHKFSTNDKHNRLYSVKIASENGDSDARVFLDNNKKIGQMTFEIFIPCLICNKCELPLTFKEVNSRRSFEVPPTKKLAWCPTADASKGETPLVKIVAKHFSKESESPVDLFTTGRSTVMLASILQNCNLFVPIRLSVKVVSRMAIATLTTLLIVKNELDERFTLRPIENIPDLFDDQVAVHGLASAESMLGEGYKLEPGQSLTMNVVSLRGTFIIVVDGYTTTPVLSLFEPQRTVFRVQSVMKYKIMELEVVDTDVCLVATIKHAVFPTPIVIANTLPDVPVMVFQLVPFKPIEVEANSTSLFAFDEPTAYPSTHLVFGDCRFNVSLVEDTGPVEMSKSYNDRPIYVEIRREKGHRVVYITQDNEKEYNQFPSFLTFMFKRIVVSLIDESMRECVTLTLSKLRTAIELKEPFITVCLSLENMQIDDQNQKAICQTIAYGRNAPGKPFLSVEMMCPSCAEFLTDIEFLSIAIQRMDIEFDAQFVWDLVSLLTPLSKEKPSLNVKSKPKPTKIVSLRWVEIASTCFLVTYRGKTKRPFTYSRPPKYLKYIPRISSGKLSIPGLLICRMTDKLSALVTKISGDFIYEAFEQGIKVLGPSGRLLSSIGVTSLIASKLNISLAKDQTEELLEFARHESETFSNRKAVEGKLSLEAIEQLMRELTDNGFEPTPLLRGIYGKQKVGLKTKMIPGYGYGRGVTGILNRVLIDMMDKVKIMKDVTRVRVPRAFPSNEISAYDTRLAVAQGIIAEKKGYEGEKIRLSVVCRTSGRFICITDQFIFVFTPDLSSLERAEPITLVQKMGLVKTSIELTFQDEQSVNVTASSVTEALQLNRYILSQLNMFQLFRESTLQ